MKKNNCNSTSICIVINTDLKKQIENEAKKKNISRNAFVRLALSEYLERNK